MTKTDPSIETAISLLKELRDTTPITAQRKRIDAFLAMGEFGQPESGHGTPNLCDGIQSAHNVESATVSNPSPANSPHPPIYKTSIEEHDAWFDATFQKDFVFKDGCYSWTLAGWKAAIAAMGNVYTAKWHEADPSVVVPTSDAGTPRQLSSSEISGNSLTALEALTYLVSLKAHKDQFGKTAYYQQAQPRAWERAVKALGNESLREPVSVDMCALAMERAFENMGFDPPEKSKVVWHKNVTAIATKAVLDTVGVPYVE